MMRLIAAVAVAVALAMTGCANSPRNIGGDGAGNFTYTSSLRPHNFNVITKESGDSHIKVGSKSARFELQKGDCSGQDCTTGRERIEVFVDKKIELNDDRWFSWYFFIPEEAYFTKRATTSIGQIYMRATDWKEGSPIVQFDITGNVFQTHWHQLTKLRDPVGVNGSYFAEFGYVELADRVTNLKEKWNQLVVHFNPVIGGGVMEIFLNGELVRRVDEPVTVKPEQGYTVQYGLYRSHLEEERDPRGASIIYYDEVRFGKSREEVDDVLNPSLPIVD